MAGCASGSQSGVGVVMFGDKICGAQMSVYVYTYTNSKVNTAS